MFVLYRFTVGAALALLAALPTAAQRRLVPQQYATIQRAIAAAQPHDTVLVSPGTYFENLRFGGKNVVVASQYLLNRQDRALILSTIIDGSQPLSPDTASVVRFIDGEDSTAVLFGFTLRGGTGTKWPDPHSPGIFREGGAVLAQDASPTIRFNYIAGNQATNAAGGVSAGGGGVRVDGGRPRLLNNVIVSNQGKYGGGVVINYSAAILKNNVIAGNSADNGGGQGFGGGGVWINGAGPGPVVLENNTIVGNSSALGGGGVQLFSNPGPSVFRNNIVWANLATSTPQIGGGAFLSPEYSDVEGISPLAGPGNRNVYPRFYDSAAWLMPLSPLVDAGDPGSAFFDPATGFNPQQADLPAQGTPHNDVGAYGGPGAAELAPFAIPPTLNTVAQFRFAGGTVVGRPVAAQLPLVNQGTRELVIDSITVKPGSALTILPGWNHDHDAFSTDSLHFIWTVAGTGNYVDTIRIYHRDRQQPNPRLVRIIGTGRPNGLPNEPAAADVTLFPNPVSASGSATLAYQLAAPAPVRITLLDAVGRTIWQQAGSQLVAAGEQRQPLPTTGLRPGLYAVRLSDGAGERVLRLVVQ